MNKVKYFVLLSLILVVSLLFNVNCVYAASTSTITNISRTTISNIDNQTYTGSEIKPYVIITYKGETLRKDIDYKLTYSNNIKAGSGKIQIIGIGNYTGSKTKTFRIDRKNINTVSITVTSNEQYTGTYIKPTVIVKDNGNTLQNGKDYSVSYKDNKNAGNGYVKITGRGNYTGNIEKSFGISSVSISGASVASISNQEYTGSGILPKVRVKLNSKTLTLNRDYKVSGTNNVNVGTARLTITGIGNYTGTTSKTFKIITKNISKVKANKIDNQDYTGRRITPEVELYNGDIKLTNGTDYTLTYSNNKNVGNAKIKIIGKGNYKGSKTVNFRINKIDISEAKVSDISTKYYTGSYIKPTVTVKYKGERLILNEDYKVSYSDNKDVGTATVKITGKGNYTSYLTTTFKIRRNNNSNYDDDNDWNDDDYRGKISITKTTVSNVADQEYTGKSITPTLYIRYNGDLLEKGKDYKVSYSNNKKVGTAKAKITGKGKFTGSKTITFQIVNISSNNKYNKGNISISQATVSKIYNQKYTGSQIKPKLYIRYDGNLLKENIDYTVEYSNNVNVGKAKVTINGIGKFRGTKTLNFKIVY